jgi:hypothetical protein
MTSRSAATQALMEAVMEGPVAVSVDASNWWLYHGGSKPEMGMKPESERGSFC